MSWMGYNSRAWKILGSLLNSIRKNLRLYFTVLCGDLILVYSHANRMALRCSKLFFFPTQNAESTKKKIKVIYLDIWDWNGKLRVNGQTSRTIFFNQKWMKCHICLTVFKALFKIAEISFSILFSWSAIFVFYWSF